MYGYESGTDQDDMEFCACGAHEGVYVMRDDDGWWYVCVDCDLPIRGSYTPNESPRRNEYED